MEYFLDKFRSSVDKQQSIELFLDGVFCIPMLFPFPQCFLSFGWTWLYIVVC